MALPHMNAFGRCAVFVLLLAAGCATAAATEPAFGSGAGREQRLAPEEARRIAKEAYIYGFPVVDSYRVLHSYFVDRGSPEFKAPWNELHNEARVFTPSDKAIQTPNSDTPYSQLGADLRAEPLVLTVPAVEKGRYYSLQFIDLYTHNFAYVGSRATGGEAGSYLLAGPGWQGEKPAGVRDVIRCETQFAFVLYRTQLFDPGDIEKVKKVQVGYKVEPLSAFLGESAPAAAPAIEFRRPLTPEQQRTSPEFFEVLDFVLQFCPTHPSEGELRVRFAKLGVGAGKFGSVALPDETRAAVAKGMADAWEEFAEFKRTQVDTGKRTAADGFGTREYLMNDYLGRMSSAVLGIYGNSKEEALYPIYFTDSAGGKLDASRNRYTLRFPPGELPPVNAFWSLTMYELPSRLLVDNPLDRYLINSAMLPNLKWDADGGLTLYLQHESPGDGKDANWLPAPEGELFAVLRLYWPKGEALTGAWNAPPLERVSGDVATVGAAEVVPVTVENFARAESDVSFEATVKGFDAFGKFHHNRGPTRLDEQAVIRMNRDTLYSAGVFDLDAGPVKVSLPDAGGRFISMQVINQDHYTPLVTYGGTHTLTHEMVGTRYVMAIVRTLADASDPADLAAAAKVQDAIRVEQPGGPGSFEVPR